MPRLFRVLIYVVCGVIAGALFWGAVVQGIILSLDLKHGEGFANIPSPFLGWLALIIGGLNGVTVGAVLGFFGAVKILRSALLAAAATLLIILFYYFVIDPGIYLLLSSSSLLAVRNLAAVALILTAPSLFIGSITAIVSKRICKRFGVA